MRNQIGRFIWAPLLVLVVAAVLFMRHGRLENPSITGFTMGTSYSIQIAGTLREKQLNALIQKVDAVLEEVNRQMSTWSPTSEISQFNHYSLTEPMEVSSDFAQTVQRALGFSQATGGAFDPTLQPLLNLWGFGSEGRRDVVPDEEDILRTKALTGWEKVTVPGPSTLKKCEPQVSLDLGAIAKGYGVDCVGDLLLKEGFEDWFVEIGGEVVVHGKNATGVPWRIAVQYPAASADSDQVQGILHLSGGAVATSGDYRNYIEENGRIFSHILDPRSGRSVLSDTASVSVYASNCTDADAIATSLFVLGPENGLEWVEQMEDVDALFLVRAEDGTIIEKFSSGFVSRTGYTPRH